MLRLLNLAKKAEATRAGGALKDCWPNCCSRQLLSTESSSKPDAERDGSKPDAELDGSKPNTNTSKLDASTPQAPKPPGQAKASQAWKERTGHIAKMTGGNRHLMREDLLDFFNAFGFSLDYLDVVPEYDPGFLRVRHWWLRFKDAADLKRATFYNGSLLSTYAIHIAAHGGGESWNSLHDARMKDASGRTVVVLNVPNGMTKSDMARAFREFRLLPGSNGVDLMPSVGFSKHGQMERRPKGIVRFASAHEAQRAYRQRHAKLWRLGSGGQDEIHDIGPPRMWYLRLVQ